MIEVRELSVRVGAFALRAVSFEIPQGRYGVLMGKTGSGKTTLLEAICGLKPVLSGRILLRGRDVTGLKPGARSIGFVPQEGALFSSMNVREHLGFALEIRGWERQEIARRVDELAGLLGLGRLLERRPRGLSGGEVQRVALGRALSFRPEILCLDEPLSALDEETREQMYVLLRSVQRQTGVTALHITHSRAEAQALADLLLLIEDGRVREASGAPAPAAPEQTRSSTGS